MCPLLPSVQREQDKQPVHFIGVSGHRAALQEVSHTRTGCREGSTAPPGHIGPTNMLQEQPVCLP